MKRPKPWTLGLLLSVSGGVFACCTAYPHEHPIRLVGEQVVIVWDADRKVQHFVRQAAFDGEAKDFGFIVPTPTKPEVAEADAKVFERLQKLIPPPPTREAAGTDAAEGGFAAKVEVLDQYQVGDYLATILKAADGAAMLAWLKEHGYDSRPAMEQWLDHYAKQDWVFTALKFTRRPEQTDPKTTALRLTFQSDVPHYPYKMPSDTWPKGHVRPLALYFIAKGEAEAIYRDSSDDWEARKVWTGRLPDGQIQGLAKELGLKSTDIPAGATVTVLQNDSNKHGYDRDLDFVLKPQALPAFALVVFGIGGAAALIYAFQALAGRRTRPAEA